MLEIAAYITYYSASVSDRMWGLWPQARPPISLFDSPFDSRVRLPAWLYVQYLVSFPVRVSI